jgi:UDP-GlcNAc:undecaprenyl-phosphate GlcNAc-1-phosphate transferase
VIEVGLPTALLIPVAAAFGALATWASRAVARRLGVVSAPDPFVDQHTEPVARLGGVGIAAAAAAALALDPRVGGATAVGALLFLAAGLLDDVREFAPSRKLALQLAAASVAGAFGATLDVTGNPVLDAVGGAVWIVVIVNAVNVTDVCDGLVAGLAVIALLALGAAEPSLWEPCLAVSGACLGFLVFNAPPASIFLGDAGSSFLGFVLAALSLDAVRRPDSARPGIQALLLLGVPLFELGFVVLARSRRGVPWWRGSADHIALRLQAAGLSRWQTDAVAWTAGAALALAALTLGQP